MKTEIIVQTDKENPSVGEPYSVILRYFIPEFITALLLYSLPFWIDSYFISSLRSTEIYATLGASNNLMHFLIKIAEALSVSMVIISGQFNGRKDYREVGLAARDVFFVTLILGLFFAGGLYFGAEYIFSWYGFTGEMFAQGIPFLRLRAWSILLSFLYFACVGFMRGIKNTRVPMKIFIMGSFLFVVCDYIFIFGKLGMPAMGLCGSALASVVQYSSMLLVIGGCLAFDSKYRCYIAHALSGTLRVTYLRHIVSLSWPILIDKAVLAGAYIWLCKMINPMGPCVTATFCVVKDMERFAFLPAIAFAHVITFLVSNGHGALDWDGIIANIKRVILLASVLVCLGLVCFVTWSDQVIQMFDQKHEFTIFASSVFPSLSVLVFLDLLQLILSGALRGTGNVRTVMAVRLAVCLVCFVPFSYLVAHSAIEDQTVKFLLIYGSFYLGNGLMSIAYLGKFFSGRWKKSLMKAQELE